MLTSDTIGSQGPKKTELSYKKYLDSFGLFLKKVFLLVAGLLAGISLVYLVFVLVNANNLENTRKVILRLDQITYVLSLLSFALSLNIALGHKDKYIEILKALDAQKIGASKRKHTKNVVLSTLYAIDLGLALIDHRFMVTVSYKLSLTNFRDSFPVVFYLFLVLKALIFLIAIAAWVFVICAKRRSNFGN